MAHQIHVTSDYSIFKFLSGNRSVNLAHVKKLEASLQQGQLIAPITVNEKMEIIDGQHRFTACKNLRLPVYYIIGEGYGIKEVQVYNQNSSDWKNVDYLNAFCDMGLEPYLFFAKFRLKFPDFHFKACELILSRKPSCLGGQRIEKNEYKSDNNLRGRYNFNPFREGLFDIPDWDQSIQDAYKILKVKDYYDGFSRTPFVATMLKLFNRNNYDHDRFLHKLRLQPGILTHRGNMDQYLEIIEQIYNYRCSAEIKENLRF